MHPADNGFARPGPAVSVTVFVAALAAALYVPIFVFRSIDPVDFWWWMSANGVVVVMASALVDPRWREEILVDPKTRPALKLALGMASAAALYGVFWVGNEVSRSLFDFAAPGIDAVYGFKHGASTIRIGLSIALLIGPAEELFWRVFLQARLQQHAGKWAGLALAAALYTGVHAGSLNPMLISAALVCGLFWGLLYLRFESPLLNVVSHAVWDLAVFLFFPFT